MKTLRLLGRDCSDVRLKQQLGLEPCIKAIPGFTPNVGQVPGVAGLDDFSSTGLEKKAEFCRKNP